MSQAEETRQFEAEVSQILKLMIHSMYSNQEVFLRELISNGSDAIDKLRFEALSDDEIYEGQSDLYIEVEADEENSTITVRDTGIGMSRQEVADNIGTIARSGTKRFLEQMSGDQKEASQLIGQFGVGFYSAFIVAEKVELFTRRAGEEMGVKWSSTGEGEYTIADVEKEARGTEIVLHLREEAEEFLAPARIETVVRRYSDHISFPIYLIDESNEDEPRRQINEAEALWTRPRGEIEDEEYAQFYKHVAKAFDEPLAWKHSKIEGMLKFTMLLYLPTERPMDLGPANESSGGVKLYVNRVFILDDAEMFLPRYLRFMRGVVDSDDLPLNVSREMLQDNRVVRTIRKAATKRVLGMLSELEDEDFQTFWSTFGAVFKEGIVEDSGRQEEIAGLLRYASTSVEGRDEVVGFDDYLEGMKEGQEAIYYVTADTYEAGVASPHLEIFKEKGVEVLVMTDTVDEWVVSHLNEYKDVPLKSVDRGALDLDALGAEDDGEDKADDAEETSDEGDEVDEAWEPVIEGVATALGDRVKEVRLSKRLTDSPACLVREEWEMGERMRRLLNQAGEQVPAGTPTLELNPDHRLVKRLQEMDDEGQKEWAELFLDQARLSEGSTLDAPAVFVQRLNRLMGELAGDGAE